VTLAPFLTVTSKKNPDRRQGDPAQLSMNSELGCTQQPVDRLTDGVVVFELVVKGVENAADWRQDGACFLLVRVNDGPSATRVSRWRAAILMRASSLYSAILLTLTSSMWRQLPTA